MDIAACLGQMPVGPSSLLILTYKCQSCTCTCISLAYGFIFYVLFYVLFTDSVFWPVFFIANVAALIASRTMTTATFSCIKQSTALGCFPRLKIVHTSRKFMGQIYIPAINWFLMASAVLLVCTIASTNEIGNAYGTLFELVLKY